MRPYTCIDNYHFPAASRSAGLLPLGRVRRTTGAVRLPSRRRSPTVGETGRDFRTEAPESGAALTLY